MTNIPQSSKAFRCLAVLALSPFVIAAGCSSPHAASPTTAPASLRPLTVPASGSQADADRATLARFVGVWSFEGWSIGSGNERRDASGRAAGVIENEHFVLLDLQSTGGEFGGRGLRKAGSLLFGSEPGLGVTLTAWGDASPSVNRLIGTVAHAGAEFRFTEANTATGVHRISLTIAFETDDRWVAIIRDITAGDEPIVARYIFTRAAN